MSKKVVIIGAGVGGLSTAIHLAIKGFDVTIFEQNDFVGGKANKIFKNGYSFDTGPTLLTMPFVLKNLFQVAGKKLEDYLKIRKKEIICRYFFDDGSVFNEYSDRERLLNEFERFTSEPAENLKRYLDYSKKIYDLTAELFLFNSFLDLKNFFNLKSFRTLLNIHRIDPFRTVHQANSSFFKSKKIVQLFDRYATYNGSNPYRAPATLNIIPFVELEFGGYYVEGGIGRIPEVLAEIAKELGIKILTSTKVDGILVKNRKVVGVQIGKDKIDYNYVVSNADLYFTYEKLIKDTDTKEAKRYIQQELSTSAIIFFMGTKTSYKQLEMDNILFSSDYEREFNQLFQEKIIPDDPTIHIHISSKKNSSDAPVGCENLYVMINAPSVSNFEFDKNEVQKKIVSKIERITGIDLNGNLEFVLLRTPNDIEHLTSSYLGSLYGPSSNSRFSAFLRQQNKSRDYDGLYFVGGTVHPGGGIPLVILSGKITAELIQRHSK